MPNFWALTLPTPMSDDYLCGVFDGEGSISVTHHENIWGRRFITRIHIAVTTKGNRLPALFHERFGGKIVTYNGLTTWYVVSSKAKEALEAFVRGCTIKSDQARLALEMISLTIPKSRGVSEENLTDRQELAEMMKELKSNQYSDV